MAILRVHPETGYIAWFRNPQDIRARALATVRHGLANSIIGKVPTTMKKGIHPEYREVVFQDISTDFAFLTRSTISTKEKIQWTDGKEYPLVKVEVSSHSHPFYTGKQKIMDTAGRVDRFRRKYGLT